MGFPKAAFALAVLLAGGVGTLAWLGHGRQANQAAGGPVPAQPGASGMALGDEDRAVAAVRAHLREARAQGELTEVKLYPLGRPDELAVCGMLSRTPVVARVLLSRADSAVIAVAAREGRAPPTGRAPMVILEAGPGLAWGGPVGGPWERYCRGPQPLPPPPAEEVATGTEAPVLAAEGPLAAPGAALERVAVASPVRVRAGPSGSAEILMLAERGRVLTVHDRAPGGWLQVGEEGSVLGWAHSSLMEPAP